MITEFKLTQMITSCRRYGLPVRFLETVNDGYNLKKDFATPGKNKTDTNENVLQLVAGAAAAFAETGLAPPSPLDLAAPDKSDATDFEVRHLATVYHECTHAYMDLLLDKHDAKLTSIFKKAISWYKDAPLDDGTKTFHPDKLTHEAAGMYVAHRVTTYWKAYRVLFGLVAQTQSSSLTQAQEPSAGTLGKSVTASYELAMRRRNFGYEESSFLHYSPNRIAKAAGELEQATTSKVISSQLKSFCDDDILEGKLSDKIAETAGLHELLTQMGQRPK